LTNIALSGFIHLVAAKKSKRKLRVRQVALRSDADNRAGPAGRIMLSPETASVIRALAKHTKLTLDDLVQWMIQDFVPRNLPELDMVLDDGTVHSAPIHEGGSGIFRPKTLSEPTALEEEPPEESR
jgi:hypothetical protein